MKLKKYWEANFLKTELMLAILLAISFYLWAEFIDDRAFIVRFFSGNREAIYTALVALFGSLLGFSITAVSIVLGYANSEKLEIVRMSDHYMDLWNTFKSAILVLGMATMTTLLGLIFDTDISPINSILYINIYASILSFFRIARCIWVLNYIIAIVTKERK